MLVNRIIGALAAIAMYFAASLGVASALTSVPGDGVLRFNVTRDGDKIGRVEYRFEQQGDDLVVQIRTDITYEILSIPVYRFEHDSKEVWKDGQLVSLDSTTNDNGDEVVLRVEQSGNNLVLDSELGMVEVERSIIPASLWNAKLVQRGAAFSTVRGGVDKVKAALVDDEIIEHDGLLIPVHHYRLQGDLQRELWYDADNNVLVKVKFKASDGSTIQYELD